MIIQWIVFLVLRGLFMEQSFIDEMKEALKTQRSEILKSLATQNDDMKNLIKTVESGDEVDIASDAIEGTLLDALGAQDSKRLQVINNALDRIIQGRYGRCLKCGREIPEERLRALPYALMCIQCTTEEERRHR
jgi:RNA polymerase-binding protein DksA